MTEKQDRPATLSRRAPLALWLLLPLIVVACLGTKVYWDLDYEQRWNQYQQAGQRFNAAIKRHSKLGNLVRGRDFTGLNPDEVEALLKESHGITFDKPLVVDPNSPSNKLAVYVDPLSNTRVEVYFSIANNKYAGFGSMMQNFPVQPTQPAKHVGQQWASKVGRWMCPTLGEIFTPLPYLLWIPMLIMYCAMPGRRKWLSLVVAACATLFPLIWLMASFSLLEVKGVMSYDANFWGLIMFVVSLILLLSGGVRNRQTDPQACRSCGYSLKGNQTGVCPECGAGVPSDQQTRLA